MHSILQSRPLGNSSPLSGKESIRDHPASLGPPPTVPMEKGWSHEKEVEWYREKSVEDRHLGKGKKFALEEGILE